MLIFDDLSTILTIKSDFFKKKMLAGNFSKSKMTHIAF